VNGVDPLGEDDDDRVKEIARHFEEKYVSIVFVWNQTLTLPLIHYISCVEHELLSLQEELASYFQTICEVAVFIFHVFVNRIFSKVFGPTRKKKYWKVEILCKTGFGSNFFSWSCFFENL
jgi:hypothetical protein